MSAGWHLVHFASDQDVPHRPDNKHFDSWSKVRGKPVRIGPPMTREEFLAVNDVSLRAKLDAWCDCDLFFPVGEETVKVMMPENIPEQRWVCRRMLAMD